MDTNRWKKIEAILDHVLSLPKKEQHPYISIACKNDIALFNEVVDYLEAIKESDHTHFLQNISTENNALINDINRDDADNFIGREIGSFKITEKIGGGGMGSVFKATRIDENFDQQVAIKFVRKGLYSGQALKRFEMERQILAKLNHPNIASLYDGGITSDGNPYLIMEYIDGMPIHAYCNHHMLSINERLQLFSEVCRAIEFAHKNLIIHRDLKAQNIYVTAPGLVKILDFGIAKLLDAELSSQELIITQPGQNFWTPHYAAPEQIEGNTITTATDVYSLGILLHKLITDQFPFNFSGKTPTQIKHIIAEQSPETLRQSLQRSPSFKNIATRRNMSVQELKKTAGGDLAAITGKAIRQMPAYRYDSVSQLRNDIQNYKNDLPVSAKRDTTSYRVYKFFNRHKKGIFATAGIFLLLVCLISYYTFQLSLKQKRATFEAEKAKSATSFFITLFEASDPTEAQGDTVTARELLGRGIKRAKALKNQPKVQGQMFETIGLVYRRLGNYDQSHKLLQRSLELSKKVYGNHAFETANSLDKLGMLVIDEGNYHRAEALFRQALAIRERLQKKDNPSIADTQCNLAYALRKLGHYDKAEEFYRSSLKIYTSDFGTNNLKTIACMSSLGATLHNKGEYDATEVLFRKVLTLRRKLLGPFHPDVAMSLNNLGALMMNTGRYQEAKDLFQKALILRQKIYGSTHPKVALTMNNLALTLTNTEDFAAAESLFDKSMNMRIQLFGSDNIATAITQFGFGELRLRMNQPDSALTLLNHALTTFVEKLPENHSFIARTKMDIGSAKLAMGHISEAKHMLETGFKQIEKIHSDSSLEKALAEQQLGTFYLKKKEFKQADSLFKHAGHIFKYIEGNNGYHHKRILLYLAQINEKRKLEEAKITKD